ncbi:four-domain proteases inhibitor-like [Aplysia californica]|uniref:Four-domain proteases inhibitor-like n=1 Tax=Aplysia californica TaxID=6500 RepID=A0ABM0JRI1_APLCA|nr:four-domain proteases inhibitor-like [Aplysia californica]
MAFALGVLFLVAFAMVTTEVKAASCDGKAPTACTREYNPVCATFTKTFSNSCEMETKLCELAKDGFEATGEVSNHDCCQRGITMDYRPQCGSDGKVYPNVGSMKVAGCTNKDYITSQDSANCADFPHTDGVVS